MAKTVKGARFVLKRSETPGDSPTIPPNNDHTTGWIDTDIYQGELYLNIYDNKMWFRNESDEMVQFVELTSGGTIDPNYLPGNYIGAMVYQGTWDASTGNPPSTNPQKGDYWIVSVAGNTDLDGETDWQVGDFAIYNGATWDKIDNTEPDIHAYSVIYSHPTYTFIATAEDALDFLLDSYVDYDGGTNINITTGTGNQQNINLNDNVTISGNFNAVDITGSSLNIGSGGAVITDDGFLDIASDLTLTGGNIDVTGNISATGTITSMGNISSSGRVTGSELQTTSKLYFNTTSNRIETDGTGIRFYQSNIDRLNFTNTGVIFKDITSQTLIDIDNSTGIVFNNGGNERLKFTTNSVTFSNNASTPLLTINNSTSIATIYEKLRYNSSKTLDNNLDLVNKEYLDNTLTAHNVGLWSVGNTAYKFLAWDGGVNTHRVGINVADTTHALHVVGQRTYLDSEITVTGFARIENKLTINDQLSVNDNIVADGSISTTALYADTGQIYGDLDIDGGDLSVSGRVSFTTYINSNNTTTALGTNASNSSGIVYLRPFKYDSSSSQSQFTTSLATIGTSMSVQGTLSTTGNLTTGQVIFGTTLRSSVTTAILGTSSNGTIYLRPNGYASATDQSQFTTSTATIGTNMSVQGTLSTTGNLTTEQVIFDSTLRSSDATAILGTSSNGTIYLRPNGYASATDQSTFTTSTATIGTNMSVSGDVTFGSRKYEPSVNYNAVGGSTSTITPLNNTNLITVKIDSSGSGIRTIFIRLDNFTSTTQSPIHFLFYTEDEDSSSNTIIRINFQDGPGNSVGIIYDIPVVNDDYLKGGVTIVKRNIVTNGSQWMEVSRANPYSH